MTPGATVETYTDPATRLPVYSLYRKDSQHMTPEMLDLVDTVIYDIQDIGARFYTYISTLLYVMAGLRRRGQRTGSAGPHQSPGRQGGGRFAAARF